MSAAPILIAAPAALASPRDGFRIFRGTSFALEMPADWIDRTAYRFAPPDDTPGWRAVTISVDDMPCETRVEPYAERHIASRLTALPGSRVLRQGVFELAPKLAAVRAELRWFPREGDKRFAQLMFVHAGTEAFTAFSQLTKPERRIIGLTAEEILTSLRPIGSPTLPAAVLPATLTRFQPRHFIADRFSFAAPGDWTDGSHYVLREATSGGFARSLIFHVARPFDPPNDAQHAALREMPGLARLDPTPRWVSHGPVTTSGGIDGYALDFVRPLPQGGAVRQRQLFVIKEEELWILTLTTEEQPDALVIGPLHHMQDSLTWL